MQANDARCPNGFLISVIVPVRNEAAGIREFLEALAAQSLAPTEIVIADGGSTDQTRELIRQFPGEWETANREAQAQAGEEGAERLPAIRLLEDADAYPGRGRNLAMRAAQHEWVAMTDAGTRADPGWLAALAAEAADADIVLGTYEPITRNFFQECLALSFVAVPLEADGRSLRAPSTASLLIRKPVWEALGGFREDLRACEDLLFFAGFDASRWRIRYAPEAVVRWQIADRFAAVFRRFRAYSRHTLKAGLGGSWHRAVARMYGVGVVFLALALAHHLLWLLVPLLGLALRSWRTARVRRKSLTLRHRTGLHTYAMIGVFLLVIDAALFCGALDYWLRDRAVKPTGRVDKADKPASS